MAGSPTRIQPSSRGGAPAALSAPSAAVPNRIAVNVMALRQPEMFFGLHSSCVEYAEEGDILYKTMCTDLRFNKCGVSPVLSFPTAVGKYLAGQLLRAYVSLHNTVSFPLLRVQVRADVVSPSNQRAILLEREWQSVDGGANRDLQVEYKLAEEGEYVLMISVSYYESVTDMPKRFTPSYRFAVGRAFVEVSRRVSPLPLPCLPSSAPGLESANPRSPLSILDPVPPGVDGNNRMIVSIGLQNQSMEPLIISGVKLVPRDSFVLINDFGNACGGVCQNVEAALNLHVEAGGVRQFLFVVAPRLPVASAASSLPRPTEIGHIEWEWRQSNGDPGIDCSKVFRCARLPPPSEIEVTVSSIVPCPLVVNQPALVNLLIRNNSNTRRDANMVIAVEKVIPFALYSGPICRPLGILDPGKDLHCSLRIIPQLCSFFPLDGILEIRDARFPDHILWPAPKNLALPGGSGFLRDVLVVASPTQQSPTK